MRFYFLALGTLVIVCVGCADGQQLVHKDEYHAPPAEMLAHPGPMVGGPGPGVMAMNFPPPGIQQAQYQCPPGGGGGFPGGDAGYGQQTTQLRFLGPEGMQIGWQIGQGFAEHQITAPGRYNFAQGATYRLKLGGIPGREGLTVYPTLHIYPTQSQTSAYLSHNALPLRVNDEDLDQIETNNFVTKVIYLPDAKYQELAIAGVEELVSTRLGPGLDPVAEADRRGTIMAVIRMGNMDYEMPGQSNALSKNGEKKAIDLVDGETGNFVPPQPIGDFHPTGGNIPGDMLMGGPRGPGQPPYNMIAGVNAPMYGYPSVGTPIGLQGPPHIPLGRPAGLKSHTVRNLTDVDIGEPVDHLLYDVRHEPGIRMPHPAKHVEYTETHPVYRPGETSVPAWAN